MSAKRPAQQDGCAVLSPVKKGHFELWGIGPVTTQEEMDFKVLKFQNRKLGQLLDRYRRQEAEFQLKIEQTEKRQANDASVLCVVNRYWNQLNDDLNILLHNFGPKIENENGNEDEATSFLDLCQWDREELGGKLSQRVIVSTRIFARVLQVFDHIVQKNRKILLALKGGMGGNGTVGQDLDSVQLVEKNVSSLAASLHKKHHQISLKCSLMEGKLTAAENSNEELKIRVRDLEYDLTKAKMREKKLSGLSEVVQKFISCGLTEEGKLPCLAALQSEMDNVQKELEGQKALSTSRLKELEALNNKYRDAEKLIENLKMCTNCTPESVVETKEYKHLQSQFCMLVNDRLNLKTALEKTRKDMDSRENELLSQLEQVQREALGTQKKLQNEVIHLERSLAQLRIEYSVLKTEFEQNTASNDRARSVDEEMRVLIHSLQNYNYQLKSSIQRYKKKLEEVSTENLMILAASPVSTKNVLHLSESCSGLPANADVCTEDEIDHANEEDSHDCESGIEVNSKQLLKKLQNIEAKLLLPIMYEEAHRSQKDKENALLNELEVTGQAFESMQEQNLRLVQQLREKDDVSLKIISEKLQLSHINKMLEEQKEMLDKNVTVLQHQIEVQNEVVRKLEEKNVFLQSEVVTIRKDLAVSQQSTETEKKVATENAELAADLKVHLEKCLSELEKARSAVTEKMQSAQQKSKPEQDLAEHRQKFQLPSEKVLNQELKEFKELMTCPSCKIKQKDAVLTKCFHVFCFDCLKIRYESRQRRCPECNCGFGANDFHHLYLM